MFSLLSIHMTQLLQCSATFFHSRHIWQISKSSGTPRPLVCLRLS